MLRSTVSDTRAKRESRSGPKKCLQGLSVNFSATLALLTGTVLEGGTCCSCCSFFPYSKIMTTGITNAPAIIRPSFHCFPALVADCFAGAAVAETGVALAEVFDFLKA